MTDQPTPTPVPAPAPHPAYAVPSEPWGPLASWGTRVAASLLDVLLSMIGLVFYVVGIPLIVAGAPDSSYDSATGSYEGAGGGNTGLLVLGIAFVVLGMVAVIAIQLWNRVFRMGRTGQSLGKRVMGIRLVEEYSGQPVGAGMCFVREIAHTLDGFFYLGYLWPLWDPKRQTFADKILSTVVVQVPKS